MENGNSKMQFRMILKIILNWRGEGSLKPQATSLKKRFDIQDYPGISKITHLLQVQRRTGGN